jgi:hypothetical protein
LKTGKARAIAGLQRPRSAVSDAPTPRELEATIGRKTLDTMIVCVYDEDIAAPFLHRDTEGF